LTEMIPKILLPGLCSDYISVSKNCQDEQCSKELLGTDSALQFFAIEIYVIPIPISEAF